MVRYRPTAGVKDENLGKAIVQASTIEEAQEIMQLEWPKATVAAIIEPEPSVAEQKALAA